MRFDYFQAAVPEVSNGPSARNPLGFDSQVCASYSAQSLASPPIDNERQRRLLEGKLVQFFAVSGSHKVRFGL